MNRRARFALLVIPPIFALGALAARIALTGRPARIRTDLAQPLAVVTAWGAFGRLLGTILILTLLLSTAALLAYLALRPRFTGRAPLGWLMLAAALALVAANAWPVVFSSDVYAYAAYGDAVRAGFDPYAPRPANFHDPFVAAADWQWGGSYPPCVYGPGFVAIATAAVILAGPGGVAQALWLLRLAAQLAFLASAALLFFILPEQRRFAATAAFALNPMALWAAAEGHNDALGVCAVLAGLLAVRRNAWAGGLIVGLSPLLKAPGVLGVVLAPLVGLRAGTRAQQRFFGGAVAGLVVAAVAVLVLVLPAATALARHGRYAPQSSLTAVAGTAPALGAALLFALAGAWLLARREPAGLVWLGLGLWLGIPNPYPWYGLWVVPIAAAGLPSRPAAALWAVTILAAVRYLPDAAGNISGAGQTLLALAELSPIVVLLAARPRLVPIERESARLA